MHHNRVSNLLLGVPLSLQTQPVVTSANPSEDRPNVDSEEDSDREPAQERVTRSERVSKPGRSSYYVYQFLAFAEGNSVSSTSLALIPPAGAIRLSIRCSVFSEGYCTS